MCSVGQQFHRWHRWHSPRLGKQKNFRRFALQNQLTQMVVCANLLGSGFHLLMLTDKCENIAKDITTNYQTLSCQCTANTSLTIKVALICSMNNSGHHKYRLCKFGNLIFFAVTNMCPNILSHDINAVVQYFLVHENKTRIYE